MSLHIRGLLSGALLLVFTVACLRPSADSAATTFVVASTTSTQDSGLLDALAAAFEADLPQYRAKVIAVGSGEALELGRRGDADVLLVHSPGEEEAFMREGRGIYRRAVMRNDFVLAGPPADPAAIGGLAGAPEGFRRIAGARAGFISRGDRSGTHAREIEIWEAVGIAPGGHWYFESGQGMAETLTIAAEKGLYLLTDTASLGTFLGEGLHVLLSGDPSLVNPYSVIPVVDARRPEAARAFAEWLTGSRGASLIRDFGRRQYGRPLFVPAGG